MDRFNDIWKDRFNQGDLPDADWNTPDGEVWAAVLPHVPLKRDRRLLLLWIFLGLSLLGIFAWSYFYFQQNLTSERLSSPKDQSVLAYVEQSQARKNTLASEAVMTKAIPLSVPNAPILIAEDLPPRAHPRIKENISLQSSMDIALQRRTESRGIDRLIPVNGKPIMGDSKARQHLKKEQLLLKPESALLSPLHYLPTRRFSVSPKVNYSAPGIIIPDPLELPIPKRLKVTLQTGATYWQHIISDQYTNDLSAFDFNYSDSWGWNTNLSAGYSINEKFVLTAGLTYEQVQTYSGHNSNLSYDPGQELNGQAVNDYNATLATPYGISAANFRFSREEELGEVPIDLLVDFHSQHTIRNITVPVGLVYYPLGQEKVWQPVLSVGMGTNYLFGLSNQIASVDTHHNDIKYVKSGNAAFADPELDRLHFDIRIGAGLEYRLPSNFRVELQGTWAKGINPVFEQNDYQTRINRIQIQVGISKQF